MTEPFLTRLATRLAVLALCMVAAGCTVNPATGQQSFTAFMSPAEELRIGQEQHPKILEEFGGVYQDPGLSRYVGSIGQLLVRTSETPNLNFTFTVLNSPLVNAFAIPGGFVYVTRGLLALADNEAELAGVMAHEIGHVVARHPAQRYSQAVAANLGVTLLGVLTNTPHISRLAGLGANLYLSGYSREQEFEADMLGVRYLSRARFSPHAMSAFLNKLQANGALQRSLKNEEGRDPATSLLATHPRTAERVERAIASASLARVTDPIVAKDIYLNKIDGMLYGDDPEQGFIKGRDFIHPKLGFRFRAPPGFRLFNSARAVTAMGPNGARILFDSAERRDDEPMLYYLTSRWANFLQDTEAIDVNGMQAATGHSLTNTQKGTMDVRLLAIAFDARTIYRFIFLAPVSEANSRSVDFRRTTYSFRRLRRGEAASVLPRRIKIIKVGSGDSLRSLADRMPFEDFRLERFQVLNGLASGQKPAPGQMVKIIAD